MPFASIDNGFGELGWFRQSDKPPAPIPGMTRASGRMRSPRPSGDDLNRLLELPVDFIIARHEWASFRDRATTAQTYRNRTSSRYDPGAFCKQFGNPHGSAADKANYDLCTKILASKWPEEGSVSERDMLRFLTMPMGRHVYQRTGPYAKGMFPTKDRRELRLLLDVWANPTQAEIADLTLIDYGISKLVSYRAGTWRNRQTYAKRMPKAGESFDIRCWRNFPCELVPPPAYSSYQSAMSRNTELDYHKNIQNYLVHTGQSTVDGFSDFGDLGGNVGLQRRNRQLQACKKSPPRGFLYGELFFCPPPAVFPLPPPIVAPRFGFSFGRGGGLKANPRTAYWGIDTKKRWKDVKPILERALVAEKALYKYPWPSPGISLADLYNRFWGKELKEFVLQGPPKTYNDVRAFLALWILKHYNEAIAYLNHLAKKKAKKKKRRAITRAIISVAFGVVMMIAAPMALAMTVSAVQSAVKTYTAIKKQKKMASDLKKSAKQFARTDKAFAAELDRVSEWMDAEAAAAEEATRMSEAEKDAVAEAVAEDVVDGANVEVLVEGDSVGHNLTVEEASEVALREAEPGDRIDFVAKGKPVGLYLRLKNKIERVPPEAEAKIRGLSSEQLHKIVDEMPDGKGIPWYIVLAPVAASVVF